MGKEKNKIVDEKKEIINKKESDEFAIKKVERKTNKLFLFVSYTIIVILITVFINNQFFLKRIEKKMLGIDIEETDKKESGSTISVISRNLEAIREKLKEVYKGEIDDSKLAESAMKGYVEGLGDKYTEYYTKEEWQGIKERVKGKYVGIGVELVDKEGSTVITGIMKGTPAEEVGLKEEDIIIKVNDIDVREKKLDEIVKEIKGKKETEVLITVIRDGKELTFKVIRKEIKVDSTIHKLLDNGIGYLDLKSFSEESDKDIEKAIEEMKQQGMTKLILDLRYNGGGDVKTAQRIADLFLDKDKEIYSTINAKDYKKTVYTKTKAKYDFEIVLLVNKYSASASELLTLALKENKRVKEVVGETTYGKGVIQAVYPSSTGGALKVTTEEYFGPNGVKLNKIGVEPTIKVEQSKITKREIIEKNKDKSVEEIQKLLIQNDLQLQKAIEVLQQ